MAPKVFTLNTGANIPWLGFGTGSALHLHDAQDLVKLAIDNGITHLDGAEVYTNEDTLGVGIRASGKPRSELFVTTKFWGLAAGTTIRESLQSSLSKLGLDYVDLFLIHDPTKATKPGELVEWWKGMEEVYREGLAKAIGISNFTVERVQSILDIATVIPAVNQIEVHPYVWTVAKPIVELCQAKGILIASYSGLTPIVRVSSGPLDPIIAGIRERLEKARGKPVSAGQVLTKWLLQKDIVVVTTSSKVERIHEFLDVENVPDLTAEEMQAMVEAGSKLYKRAYMDHCYE